MKKIIIAIVCAFAGAATMLSIPAGAAGNHVDGKPPLMVQLRNDCETAELLAVDIYRKHPKWEKVLTKVFTEESACVEQLNDWLR